MTFVAIHHDIKDSDDGLDYYYAAFIMENIMQVVKINKADNTIKWNYQYIR